MRRLAHHTEMEDDDEDHGIDLAPMLDFVLNLLIFFIITAIFVKEVGLTLSSPPPSNQAKQNNDDNNTLYIAVHSNGDISIDQRLVDKGAVRANVERFHGEKPNGSVIVVANTKSPTGVVVGVMDQVRLGGVMSVSIAPSNSGGTR
jgi:biopolymer transport protein ExbD